MSAPFDSRAAAADLSRRMTIRVLERAGIDASDLVAPAWQKARAPAERRTDHGRLAEPGQGPDSNQKKDWPRDGETPTDASRRGSGGAPAPPVAKLSFGAKPPRRRRRSDEEIDQAWRVVAWQAGLDCHAAELAARQFRDTAAATGLDAHALIEDGRVVPRARMLSWLGPDIRCCRGKRCACRVTGDDGEKLGLPCDGISRRTRIAHCGSVHPALRIYEDGHREVGLAHWRCRDRWCPVCAAERQSKTAAELRPWCEHRGLARLAFVTLTQVKLGHDDESCRAALDRLKATQRACFNTKTARGRALRVFFVGGVVFEEVTWSPRGEARKDGTLVAYDGWHAHIHAIVELAPPPDDLVTELGEREAWVVWRKRAYDALLEAWLEVSVGAVAGAQKICDLDVDRIGQVCKYPLKPMEHAHVPAYREAVFAIGGRRMHDAFGSWRGWRSKLKEVARDRSSSEHAPDEDQRDRPMTLLAQEPYSILLDDLGRCRIDDHSMIEYGRGPAAERRPVGELRRAVERDPRTFDCRDRAERESGCRKETSEAAWTMARERARARHAPTFAWVTSSRPQPEDRGDQPVPTGPVHG